MFDESKRYLTVDRFRTRSHAPVTKLDRKGRAQDKVAKRFYPRTPLGQEIKQQLQVVRERVHLAKQRQPSLEHLLRSLLHMAAEGLFRRTRGMLRNVRTPRWAAATSIRAHLGSLIEHLAFAQRARQHVLERVAPVVHIVVGVDEDVGCDPDRSTRPVRPIRHNSRNTSTGGDRTSLRVPA